MKTFYTERDIEDMHAAGVTEIEISDDVILTHIANEKAVSLGIRVRPVKKSAPASATPPRSRAAGDDRPQALSKVPTQPSSGVKTAGIDSPGQQISKIKAAVSVRLGTHAYDDLLDLIIPLVWSRINNKPIQH